jgi:hypothetical protein
VKVEPLPSSLFPVSEPPMALASLRLIGSPSPVPIVDEFLGLI